MRLVWTTIMLAAFTLALAQDFRGMEWGASREQVKATETWELVEERQDGLLYRGAVAGLNALAYFFILPEADQLAAARYVFVDDYSIGYDSQYTLDDFENLAALLSQKYGSPSNSRIFTSDPYQWALQDTEIFLRREEEKGDWFVAIDYWSVDLRDAWDAWLTSQNPF